MGDNCWANNNNLEGRRFMEARAYITAIKKSNYVCITGGFYVLFEIYSWKEAPRFLK